MFSQAGVKNSVHRRGGGGVYPCIPLGIHPSPLGRHPSPYPSTMGYGQQAGGTHPTGMHSCSCMCALSLAGSK